MDTTFLKTEAAVLCRQNSPLEWMTLQIPPLKDSQVLVKVLYSSLCHSQLNEVEGKRGPDAYLPHTLGHEGVGEVIGVGPLVTKVKKEDQVVLSWLPSDGRRSSTIFYQNEKNNERINSGPISTFLTHAVISEDKVMKLTNPKRPLEYYSLLGCAMPTGFGVVVKDLELSERKDIQLVVFGLGGVGQNAVMTAKMLGIKKIIGVDLETNQLERAKMLGADECYNFVSDQERLIASLARDEGKLPSIGIDCTGNLEAIEKGFSLIKEKFCIVGNPPVGDKLKLDPYDFIKGKKMLGSWGGGIQLHQSFSHLQTMLENNFTKIETMVTHRLNLIEINQALQLLKSRNSGKIILQH